MTDDPVDLSAIDPTTPPSAFEARLRAVRHAARHALRRRRGGDALSTVVRWRVPLMAALLLVTLASAALFRLAQGEPGPIAEPTDEIADVFGDSVATDGDIVSGTTSTRDLLLGGYQQ